MQFNATDQSAIANITTLIDDQPILPSLITQTGSIYRVEIGNLTLQVGSHLLILNLIDDDNDRKNDSLSTIIVNAFTATPVMAMNHILNELNALEVTLPQDLTYGLKNILLQQIHKAMQDVNWSIQTYIDSKTCKSIILDKLAKVHLSISNAMVELGNWIGCVDDSFMISFLNSTREIKNELTLIIGEIVGTDLANTIATIETEILNLANQIHDEISLIKAMVINLNLWQACNNLDSAMVLMTSTNNNAINELLQDAMKDLNKAIYIIYLLKNLGCISLEQANSLISTINEFIARLSLITS
ncbi:MAG: hypothetical protein EAX96_17165 [Candidatus Lokiarchaeota archaeon]|nr:hypothetical protein [Candidatus Lokiarchaeota archaeon]